MVCVFPGVEDIFASAVLSVSILIREDFPTFDRPIKAYSGISAGGQSSGVTLLLINFVVVIFKG